MKVKIFDHFGLDVDDIKKFGTAELVIEKLPREKLEKLIKNIPTLAVLAISLAIRSLTNQAAEGFRAWFILQHYRGYRPFITVMEKEITIEG